MKSPPGQPAAPAGEPTFFSRQIAEARRFFLRHDGPGTSDFQVACGGTEQCTPDYRIARDGFPFVAVEFVAKGEGTLILDGKSHSLLPGVIFAYGPGHAHDLRCVPGKPMTKYFVDFAGSRVLRRFHRPAPKPGQIMQSSAAERVASSCEQLIAAGMRDTPFREHLCRVIGEYLLLAIAETAVPSGTSDTIAFETFQRCQRWIDAHYRRVESLEQIARECGVAAGYMCRLFKRFAHQSPWQYVLRLRMRDAIDRLQTPGASITQIAYEFGFGDPFQFSRTFRKQFGISPREFTRMQKRTR
jgi:AraC-like DNA-binding protein